MSDGAQPLADSGASPEIPNATTAKNIVICCDGTGNEFGDANSNVVKFYTALAIDNQQVGYYHPGVGTMGDPAAGSQIAQWWSQIRGLAFAAGFKANVLDAYRYLMEVYNDGDRVFLIGFSRGAYTVRALAGLLDGYGLLCRGNEGHLPYAWRLYVRQHKDRSKRHLDHHENFAAAFKETFSRKNLVIQFVGVWDTVSSVGWITSPLRLFNVAQNASIRVGRQALSIDERRCFYRDNLWGEPLAGQDIQQVWFAGVHSDIGGSYPQEQSALSNITLRWMLHEANAAGIDLVPDRVHMILGDHSVEDPDVQPLYRKPARSIVHHSLKDLWWLLEFLPHRFYDKDDGRERYRIPLGVRRNIPSGSLVHYTALDRMSNPVADYRPSNLDPQYLQPVAIGETVPGTEIPLFYKYNRPPNPPADSGKRILLLILFSLLDTGVALAVLWGIFYGVGLFWLYIRDGLHHFIWG